MAQGVRPVSRYRPVPRLTPPDPAYGLARFSARFMVTVSRTGRRGGGALPGSGEPSGIDAETLPGGGEPSAVKSDFCSASVFAAATGGIACLFMPMTFTLRRDPFCRAAVDRRLSLSEHGPDRHRLAAPSAGLRMSGSQAHPAWNTSFRGREARLRRGVTPAERVRSQASERT